MLECSGLSKTYPAARRGEIQPPALSDATVYVRRGECLGVVGESGSGKTTLANCLAGLFLPAAGTVSYDGQTISAPGARRRFPRVRGIQVVFQDPASSLNPLRSVGSVLREIIRVHDLRPKGSAQARVDELLAAASSSGWPSRARSRSSRG